MDVRVLRVYDAGDDDGAVRVLVDRVWPRGIRKDQLALDEWAKDVAPSTELRKWYGHDPAKFAEFRRRYLAELRDGAAPGVLGELRRMARDRPVILLTATKDVPHSHAVVLADELRTGQN